jgi:hypothetical protein
MIGLLSLPQCKRLPFAWGIPTTSPLATGDDFEPPLRGIDKTYTSISSGCQRSFTHLGPGARREHATTRRNTLQGRQ